MAVFLLLLKKKKKIWMFKKCDHWKWQKKKKINKDLNIIEKKNKEYVGFEKQVTQIEKYNTLDPSSPKRPIFWA